MFSMSLLQASNVKYKVATKYFFAEIHNYQVKYYEKYLQIHSVARNVCVYHFPALRILIELIDLKSSTNQTWDVCYIL